MKKLENLKETNNLLSIHQVNSRSFYEITEANITTNNFQKGKTIPGTKSCYHMQNVLGKVGDIEMRTISNTSNSSLSKSSTTRMEIAPRLDLANENQKKEQRKTEIMNLLNLDTIENGDKKLVIVLDFEDTYQDDRTHKYNLGIISDNQLNIKSDNVVRIDIYKYISEVRSFVRKSELLKYVDGDLYDITEITQTECETKIVNIGDLDFFTKSTKNYTAKSGYLIIPQEFDRENQQNYDDANTDDATTFELNYNDDEQ